MLKGKRIRLYPTEEQAQTFFRYAGASRFAYNECVAYCNAQYQAGRTGIVKQPELRQHLRDLRDNVSEYEWLREIPEAVVNRATIDFDKARAKAFKKRAGFPRFHKRHSKASFYQRTDGFHTTKHGVKITGIKEPVRVKFRKFPDHALNTRVIWDGKYWYLSYAYETGTEPAKPRKHGDTLGIDLGIKNFAVVSDGTVFSNINYSKEVKKLEKRKRHLQRRLSKKLESNRQGARFVHTSNSNKLQRKVALLNRKLTNIRSTYINEVIKDILSARPKRIVIEDLNVRGMMKNRYLARSIANQKFAEFANKLSRKCEETGIELVKADRWFPSSKTCSGCGFRKQTLSLSERIYVCEHCGLVIDRDLNAALNLANYPSVAGKLSPGRIKPTLVA
ncbi:IS200/IS605 family element transposase accessory protein TnpB [Mobiluncus curtisii]|uniref:RNA-guided endonuclease InsQ/TnpB family protein n=1 Tax=Mobiluncus curtisii TaxID=2051 RepID=UPI001470313A|nr:RNA-guided endonuclease TnpB family protein [Mobiluncus curtisii]NMW43507.1 IS200/IS605 family element transposase accessory protein TnpB [Mobiluncus curtisii]